MKDSTIGGLLTCTIRSIMCQPPKLISFLILLKFLILLIIFPLQVCEWIHNMYDFDKDYFLAYRKRMELDLNNMKFNHEDLMRCYMKGIVIII